MIRFPKTPQAAAPVEQKTALKLQLWLVVGTCPVTQQQVVLYHGRDSDMAKQARREAAALGVTDVAIRDAGFVYPPPEQTPGCLCADWQTKALRCPYGHEHECHYPETCAEADCAYLATLDGDGDALTDELERRVQVREADRYFTDSPAAGEPGCVCSRCQSACSVEPLRIMDAEREEPGEWRYCERCA